MNKRMTVWTYRLHFINRINDVFFFNHSNWIFVMNMNAACCLIPKLIFE